MIADYFAFFVLGFVVSSALYDWRIRRYRDWMSADQDEIARLRRGEFR